MTELSHLVDMIAALKGARVLTVGDVMLDRYVNGRVDRISPEAPIPVLHVEGETAMLGGAGNVVANIAALGGAGRFVALVGDDGGGDEVTRLLKTQGGIEDDLAVEADRHTTLKTRFVGAGQQLMRADVESEDAPGAEAMDELSAKAGRDLAGHGAVILSDYGKGVLSDALIQTLIASANKAEIPVIVDPKGQDYTRYKGADLITPNAKELREATHMPTRSDEDVIQACEHLIATCGVGGSRSRFFRVWSTLTGASTIRPSARGQPLRIRPPRLTPGRRRGGPHGRVVA